MHINVPKHVTKRYSSISFDQNFKNSRVPKLFPSDDQFSGAVTYNGHGMKEFVPQRTAAYISQNDVHTGEMTVRETLAFSARCQGVGSSHG